MPAPVIRVRRLTKRQGMRLTKQRAGSSPEPIKTVPDPVHADGDPVWTTSNAAKRGRPIATHPLMWLSPAHSLPTLLTATAAPAMTSWLPLKVVIVDNDRGDSPRELMSRARA